LHRNPIDQAWSFVQEKANKQWIWAIQHRESKQIIALPIGDRSAVLPKSCGIKYQITFKKKEFSIPMIW